MRSLSPVVLCLLSVSVSSAELAPRLLGGVHVGSAGLEIVGAAEWEIGEGLRQRLRPEIIVNDRPRPGVGFSWTFAIADGALPNEQELFVGPRVVLHNNDDDLEIGAIALYRFPIVPSQAGKHTIDAIGGLGLLEDDDDDWGLGITFGAAYGYQF
jgi:hypothetical protein